MILQTAYYDDGVYQDPPVTEPRFLDYTIIHEFNRPARAIIRLGDWDGTMIQKYNVAADAVYVGPGKAEIQDPDATYIFYGRIIKAERTDDGFCVLTAEDWLSQLDETKIDYDMREDLNGSGLRESQAKTDPDNGVAAARAPAYHAAVGEDYVFDDDMNWAANQWDGMHLTLTAGMAGDISLTVGPYAKTTAPATDNDSASPQSVWENDGSVDANTDNDASWDVTYDYRVLVNASTGFFVTGSITSIRVLFCYQLTGVGTTAKIYIYNHTSATWVELDNDLTVCADGFREGSYTVPSLYNAEIMDANGIAHVKISVTWPGGGILSGVWVDQCAISVDCSTTGYSSAVVIHTPGTGTNYIRTDTDMTAAATKIWEGVPYCINRPIYKHIDSAETPGTLITNGDILYALTCDATIEHTTGYSTAHFSNRTRLEILRELAQADKAVFWAALGTSTVTWKSTFNSGAPTALGDANVLSWDIGRYDYSPMRNAYTVLGIRIGDSQVLATSTNAASVTDYGMTRNEIVTSPDAVSLQSATDLATALAAKDKDVILCIEAILPGLATTTYRLGQEVSVTSSILNVAAVAYVVIEMDYDSRTYCTRIRLLPRASLSTIGLPNGASVGFAEAIRQTVGVSKEVKRDQYMAKPPLESYVNP